jgi:hypothetical protein
LPGRRASLVERRPDLGVVEAPVRHCYAAAAYGVSDFLVVLASQE